MQKKILLYFSLSIYIIYIYIYRYIDIYPYGGPCESPNLQYGGSCGPPSM